MGWHDRYISRSMVEVYGKCRSLYHTWVFPKIGVVNPPKWMVKKKENPIKMDDLGVPLFLETPR